MDIDQRPESRADQVAAQRRRRDDTTLGHKLKLALPDEVRDRLAAEGRTPRWVNDTGSRIADLTQRDDYDKVDGIDPVKVDVDDEGKPIFAHLLAKRNDFIAEDRSKADKRRREVEAGMLKGKVPGAAGNSGEMGATTFVDPASRITRANQVIE